MAMADERLKPMSVDPDRPLMEAIPTVRRAHLPVGGRQRHSLSSWRQLQSEFIKFMDFETEYVCRLYAPKQNVLERSWLTLRKSLREQNVTMYDYVVLYPLKLNMPIALRSWAADISTWLVKRSIKGDRYLAGNAQEFSSLTHSLTRVSSPLQQNRVQEAFLRAGSQLFALFRKV